MASNVTKTQHPAIIVPDPRWTYADAYSSADSTVTQAGPLPGIPEPQQDSPMVLQSSGTQSANKALRIRAINGGNPAPDAGSFGWRNSGDTLWRGWNPPTTLQAWQSLDATTTAGAWLWPHALRLTSGVVLIAVQEAGTTISVWKRTTAGVWSNIDVATHGTYTYLGSPTLCQLDSGRILLYAWWEDGTANQIRLYYSDDDGATWSVGSKGVLPAALTTSGTVTPRRLRVATFGGQVLLVAGVRDTGKSFDHYLMQYASIDGWNFSSVESWAGDAATTHACYHDLVVVGGKFYLGYLASDGADVVPYGRKIGNAYTPFSSAEVITAQPTTGVIWGTDAAGVPDCTLASPQEGDYALALDDDGILYAVGRDVAGNMECVTLRSVDQGETWQTMGTSAAVTGSTWWNIASNARYPHGFALFASQGRLGVVHNYVSSATLYDPSLCVGWLGGYTTVCLPSTEASLSARTRVSWERTWLPFDLPDTGGTWAYTASGGAPVITATGVSVTITGIVGDAAYWDVNPTSTYAQGILAVFDGIVAGGLALARVRSGTAGPACYDVEAQISTTGIQLYDNAAAAYLTVEGGGTTYATTLGPTGFQILMAIGNGAGAPGNDGKLRVWLRRRTSVAEPDADWVLICQSSTLTQGAAAATNLVRFGSLVGGAPTVSWRAVHYTSGAYTGYSAERLYGGQTNPGDLLGRFFATTPVYVDDGVSIAALSGPSARGDVWNIDTDYSYGVRNLWPEVASSPFRGWRATGETQTDIVWYADPDTLTNESVGLRGTRALVILGANWRDATLAGYDAGGASYVNLATIDMATGFKGMRWTRAGSIIHVDTGGASTAQNYFWHEHMLAGSHIKLDGTPEYRQILTNSAGAWTATTTQRARVLIDGAAAGDGTSGTAGQIWSQAAVIILGDTDAYTKYRLRISAQTTAEGHFRIGSLLWGHLVPFAHRPSWNRVVSTRQNTRLTTLESGARVSTVLGPPRRTVELGWSEGVDVSQAYGAGPTPDYILPYTGSTEPAGAPAEVPSTLEGLVGQLGGANSLVAYIGRWVPPASSTAFFLNDPYQIVLGRLVGDPQVATLIGNEYASPGEVVTVAGVTIEEEV